MNKILMTIAAVLCCWVTLYAQPLTEQEAKERVLQYMNSGKAPANARRMAAPAQGGHMKLEAIPVEAEKVYAFNMEGGGFVIASGDQRTLPVLGYSTTGSIDGSRMPENMRSWLKHYDDAIATLGDRTDFEDGDAVGTTSGSRVERSAIAPLVKSHWYQTEPYWNQSPIYQGANQGQHGNPCYSGCVATAMAQVMNYWRWPNTVPDGLPEYDVEEYDNGVHYFWHIGALPPTWFDWDNMADDYAVYDPVTRQDIRLETTAAQDKAVATLMRYCGQAVKMWYGTDEMGGSSAYTSDVATALVNYFDYNAAQHVERNAFPNIGEWEDIMYGELAAGRPIVYHGQSGHGGHAFVCDGYGADGMFHINWGWGGYCDGYFSLAVLNPYNALDMGSYSIGLGFCIDEGAIVYTDPKMDPQPYLHHDFGNIFFQRDPMDVYGNHEVWFSCFSSMDHYEVADLALGTIDADGTLRPMFISDPNDSILYMNWNWFMVEVDSTAFTPGQSVTLYPMLRFRHPGQEWQIVPPMEQNLTVGYDDSGRFFIQSNFTPVDMKMTDIAMTGGNARLDERSDFVVRMRNNNTADYTNSLYIYPVYLGHIKPDEIDSAPTLAVGGMIHAFGYLPAGQEADVRFSFAPEYGGIVVFDVYENNYRFVDRIAIELNNDTLIDYKPYVENKSYISHEGDQWFYNVEFADRIGTTMPHWVPSDSLKLIASYFVNNEKIERVILTKELHDYLLALPDSIGTGDYTLTCQIPIDLSQPADYYLDSYLGYYVNGKLMGYFCLQMLDFRVDELPDATGVALMDNGKWIMDNEADPWYDLNGRRLSGKPTAKGIYIRKGKKVIIH